MSGQYTLLCGVLKDMDEVLNGPHKTKGLSFRNAIVLFMGIE